MCPESESIQNASDKGIILHASRGGEFEALGIRMILYCTSPQCFSKELYSMLILRIVFSEKPAMH